MSHHNLMKDPDFAQALYVVEKRIAELDADAAAKGITLSDSNVRSILVKVANMAKGKTTPAAKKAPAAPANPKDAFIDSAVQEIAKVRDEIAEERDPPDGGVERHPLNAGIWIKLLECVKESCAIRTTPEPASRGYLDFLPDFLKRLG